MKLTLPFFLLLAACSNPFQGKGPLTFRKLDKATSPIKAPITPDRTIEKRLALEEIITDANESFEEIKPLLKNKCFDCHDANTKLRIYGRILPRLNPVAVHQKKGLAALDFSQGFPLKANGNPSQIALLNSLKSAVSDGSMPPKAYVTVFRARHIYKEDQALILAWVEPLISKLEEYGAQFENTSLDPKLAGRKLLENKCFRCHANGNARGGFGGMEDTKVLMAGPYFNLKDPLKSRIYTISESGEMPLNKLEALGLQDLDILREWLLIEAGK